MGLGISSIASSSLGDTKTGYPKGERCGNYSNIGLGSFPLWLCVVLLCFHRFPRMMVCFRNLGRILWFLGIRAKFCNVRFSVVFELLFCWGNFAESCFFSFCPRRPKSIIRESLIDRGGGIGDFQHCIVSTRGKEERIPITASAAGTNIGLKSFSLWLCDFSDAGVGIGMLRGISLLSAI